MATKMWPWTVKLRELVSEGPVPFHRAMAEMMALVPPGRAFRDGERQAAWHLATANAEKPNRNRKVTGVHTKEETKDARIKRGAHRLAYQAIWQQKRAGVVEFFDEDGQRMVRAVARPEESADD